MTTFVSFPAENKLAWKSITEIPGNQVLNGLSLLSMAKNFNLLSIPRLPSMIGDTSLMFVHFLRRNERTPFILLDNKS